MPRLILFRICCLFVVGVLTLVPAVMAAPSLDLQDESTIHKPFNLKGLVIELWQTATRPFQPQAPVLKNVTYVAVPYFPYFIPVPTGGGAGTTMNPDGVSYQGG